MNKFLSQTENLGLILVRYVINETWVDLSCSTIWFTLSVLTVQNIGLEIVTKDMMDVVDECIIAIFNSRFKFSKGDSPYAQKNFKFILEILMPHMIKSYKDKVGYDNKELLDLAKKHGVHIAPPKKANITYTSNEYL